MNAPYHCMQRRWKLPVALTIAALALNAAASLAIGQSELAKTSAPSRSVEEFDDIPARNQLSPPGKLEVVRTVPAADFRRGALATLPRYDAASRRQWQVDLRGCDVSALDLSERLPDLQQAEFDSRTKWPAALPRGFDPAAIMMLNRNPGLGVRALHARGITGRGIGLAIIDQALLVDHEEYKDRLRLYEEIHLMDDNAAMHGAAVASIAVGKTVGVAPEANLYFIAETHGRMGADRRAVMDFVWLAKSIDRILEVNQRLKPAERIRVISASIGWSAQADGYKEVVAAVERAKAAGIFVVSSSLEPTYGFSFQALGRDPMSDPDDVNAYRPGRFWADSYWSMPARRFGPDRHLLVPMDSRTTASPTATSDYVFYPHGGWSWSIPWIAGLYALACQVKPDVTPAEFWAAALATGSTIKITHEGETVDFGRIANPAALIEMLQRAKPSGGA